MVSLKDNLPGMPKAVALVTAAIDAVPGSDGEKLLIDQLKEALSGSEDEQFELTRGLFQLAQILAAYASRASGRTQQELLQEIALTLNSDDGS